MEAAGFTFPSESEFHAPLEYTEFNQHLSEHEIEIGYDQETGTRITEEFGKTVFGNWVITRPHQTSVARITYRSPIRVFEPDRIYHPLRQLTANLGLTNPSWRYSVFIEHQPGINDMQIQSHVIVPPSWRTMFTTPRQNVQQYSDGVKLEQEFSGDVFFGITAEQK